MNTSDFLARQGHRLIQVGVAFLLFACLEGFVIPVLRVPHLGLSLHTLSALLGVLLPTHGLFWPRLRLGMVTALLAFWLLLYSSIAIVGAYTLVSLWGAGHGTMPLAAGAAQGTAEQETMIRVIAYSSAPTGIGAFALILWGLRFKPPGTAAETK
jgi:hydroxylaminobenzene mutase